MLILAILACNMPFEQIPPPGEVQTAAALTVLAAVSTRTVAPTATASATPPQRTPSPTESPDETTTITPTYSVPILTVRESTNCRTGPGEGYEVVVTYLTGKELEIIGRYDPGNFWLVRSNESPAGTCWITGEFSEVTGSTGSVPSVTPPATATSAPPRAAVILEWNFFCSDGSLNFTVTWREETTDETGFRVFRNGEAVTELAPNSTTFTDVYDIGANESVEYYIQVYSPTGTANTSIMRMRCGG
ncbi:MAG: hypothetical protein M3Y68_04765 [Chloroflexota bacterium]|nr:hypothetical protein [Chloroflexota bacterium]